ncbi:MAG: ADP-glyceromanno-heptose 6-epimerase [Bacteroidales bacterium]|nr:ADP-glyceromanno-heptose 6-epimerase [Bacteroidales bacterium]
MIVVTGAAGFIASVVAKRLNEAGMNDLVLVDDFSRPAKEGNYQGIKYRELVPRKDFFQWFDTHSEDITFVVHLGARTDTTEFDVRIFDDLNLGYSKEVWNRCSLHRIPLIYASSAATYGSGELGYDDNHEIVPKLQPLNPYGRSKNDFDIWALQQEEQPPFWAGLKFFNVYGPNEYHKGRMASVILHAFRQIQENGKVRLFRSHRPDFKDGEQLRDFVYVKDISEVILFLMKKTAPAGLYNLGTGKARTFLDLTRATFAALNKEPVIEFMDTPEDIRDKYQYFTEANMKKLKNAGYEIPFTSLEEGVTDYVRHYLVGGKYY